MGLFDLFKKKPKRDLAYAQMLNGYTPIYSQFGTDIYASDVVQQAVSCIIREMRKLDPQHVIKKGSDITPVFDDVQAVLDNPNPLMGTGDFIEKTIWLLYRNYNAFICPTWDGNGRLTGLYPLDPIQVDFLSDARDELHVKLWFANDYSCVVPYADIIHIRLNFSVNEFMGGDELGQADHSGLLKTLELNNSLLEGVDKALKSSFIVNGVVKMNTMLEPEKSEKALKELSDALRRNESGLMAMDMKGEYIPIDRKIALVDATTLKFIDEKILRHFGVSLPILTGDYTKEQYEAFYQKTLEPLIKSISQAFTKTLFSRRESNGYGHRVMFYAKELVFMSTQEKLSYITELGLTGAIFENEKRTIMGLKPLPELEGVRKCSLNYVDVAIANEYQLKNKGSESEKDEPEEEEPDEVQDEEQEGPKEPEDDESEEPKEDEQQEDDEDDKETQSE